MGSQLDSDFLRISAAWLWHGNSNWSGHWDLDRYLDWHFDRHFDRHFDWHWNWSGHGQRNFDFLADGDRDRDFNRMGHFDLVPLIVLNDQIWRIIRNSALLDGRLLDGKLVSRGILVVDLGQSPD